MSALAPGPVVKGVLLTPPAVSLLSAAIIVDEVDERWVNGIHYVPEGCGEAQVYNLCSGDTKSIAARGVAITGTPYAVIAQDTCGTFSYKVADYVARASRKLLAVESYYIARELWAGALALNPKLADPIDTITAGSVSPEVLLLAIGTIEEAFYASSHGARAMIHMSPGYLEALQTYSGGAALRRGGSTYYTQMDSVIAVDRGYPGTGPAGQAKSFTSEWIYATPIVQIRRGPLVITPTNMSEAMLRTENSVTFFAERAVVATWDYNCPTIALNVKRNG